MSVVLVYADFEPVPAHFKDFVGVERFGNIIFRRQRILDRVSSLAKSAGISKVIHLHTSSDIPAVAAEIQAGGFQRVIHVPSWLTAAHEDRFKDRLRRLSMVDDVCYGRLGDEPIPLLGAPQDTYLSILPRLTDRETALAELVGSKPVLNAELGGAFIDIRETAGLIDLLSNAFAARHFNQMERTRHYVVKRSINIAKIRAEHNYYYLLPPTMQHWLVMPFDLCVGDRDASYTMERLLALDMGQQWINGSISPTDFVKFLEDIMRFLEERDRRSCSADRARASFDELYVQKVRKRLEDLAAHPLRNYLNNMVSSGTSYKSLDHLSEAYFDLIAPYRNSLPDYEVIGHGDPCFSNILYDKRIRLMKLIDPKGAITKDELYTDPWYDYAKLSHSVLGGYDFIVNGLYGAIIDEDLRLRLTTPEANFGEYSNLFMEALTRRDLDCRRIRLYEASLFLSMLPLHVDTPRNLLAFTLIAAHILHEVTAQ